MLSVGTRIVRADDDYSVGIMGTILLWDYVADRYVVRWDDDSTEALHASKVAVPYHQR